VINKEVDAGWTSRNPNTVIFAGLMNANEDRNKKKAYLHGHHYIN